MKYIFLYQVQSTFEIKFSPLPERHSFIHVAEYKLYYESMYLINQANSVLTVQQLQEFGDIKIGLSRQFSKSLTLQNCDKVDHFSYHSIFLRCLSWTPQVSLLKLHVQLDTPVQQISLRYDELEFSVQQLHHVRISRL